MAFFLSPLSCIVYVIYALRCVDNIFAQAEKLKILKNNNSNERQKSVHWNIILCYALRIAAWRMANIRINFDVFVCVMVCLVRNLLKMRQKMHHQLYIYTSAFTASGFRLRPLVEHFHWLRNEVNLHRISFFSLKTFFCECVRFKPFIYSIILFSKRMPRCMASNNTKNKFVTKQCALHGKKEKEYMYNKCGSFLYFTWYENVMSFLHDAR